MASFKITKKEIQNPFSNSKVISVASMGYGQFHSSVVTTDDGKMWHCDATFKFRKIHLPDSVTFGHRNIKWAVCAHKNLFVGVGSHGHSAISYDGINWIADSRIGFEVGKEYKLSSNGEAIIAQNGSDYQISINGTDWVPLKWRASGFDALVNPVVHMDDYGSVFAIEPYSNVVLKHNIEKGVFFKYAEISQKREWADLRSVDNTLVIGDTTGDAHAITVGGLASPAGHIWKTKDMIFGIKRSEYHIIQGQETLKIGVENKLPRLEVVSIGGTTSEGYKIPAFMIIREGVTEIIEISEI